MGPGPALRDAPEYDNGLVAAIGNNRVEAMAALLASWPALSGLPNVEGLLKALQAGLLPDVACDLVSVEEQLHENEFAGRSGGSLWQVRAGRPPGAPRTGARAAGRGTARRRCLPGSPPLSTG